MDVEGLRLSVLCEDYPCLFLKKQNRDYVIRFMWQCVLHGISSGNIGCIKLLFGNGIEINTEKEVIV